MCLFIEFDKFVECFSSTWSENIRPVSDKLYMLNHFVDCEHHRRVSDQDKCAEEERWYQIRWYKYALSRELDPRVN